MEHELNAYFAQSEGMPPAMSAARLEQLAARRARRSQLVLASVVAGLEWILLALCAAALVWMYPVLLAPLTALFGGTLAAGAVVVVLLLRREQQRQPLAGAWA